MGRSHRDWPVSAFRAHGAVDVIPRLEKLRLYLWNLSQSIDIIVISWIISADYAKGTWKPNAKFASLSSKHAKF